MPRAVPSPIPFQWQSEVSPPNDEPLPSPPPDDEPSVAEATSLVHARCLHPDQLHHAPFARLSTPLLLAIRDDAINAHVFSACPNPALATAVTQACVLHLNRLASDTARNDAKFSRVKRQFVLLSLLDPAAVISALCKWAARQSVAVRQAAVCGILTALGCQEPWEGADVPAIVVCVRDMLAACAEEEFPPFCQFVKQTLVSQQLGEAPLFTVAVCLEHLVNPLLEKEDAKWEAFVRCVADSWEPGRAVFDENFETIAHTTELLSTYCSFDKRRAGKLQGVQTASETLVTLLGIVPDETARKLQGRLQHASPFLFLETARVQTELNRVIRTFSEEEMSQVGLLDDTKLSIFYLRQCERIIVMLASSRMNWQEVKGFPQDTKPPMHTALRAVWIGALARQLPLLTFTEVASLFGNVEKSFLPLEVLGNESVSQVEGWQCFALFSRLAIRALLLLLRSDQLRQQVSQNLLSALHVTRSVCSAFVTTASRDHREHVPPLFLYSCLISELHMLIATYEVHCVSNLADHKQIGDVLVMAVSEITRYFTLKCDKDDVEGVAQIDEITSMLHTSSQNRPLIRKTSRRLLSILSNRRATFPTKRGNS